MPVTTIRRLALTSATGGVLVLAGCSAVSTPDGPSGAQATPLSPVTVEQTFCAGLDIRVVALREASPRVDEPACRFPFTQPKTGAGRLLVAVAVPDGAADPVPVFARRGDVPFAPEPAATAGLDPAPEGYRWVGYRSGTVTFQPGDEDPGDTVRLSYPAPRTGEALSTAQQDVRVGIGVQVSKDGGDGAYDPDRPVVCDEHLEDTTPEADRDVDSTTCPAALGVKRMAIDPTDAVVEAPGAPVDVQAGSSTTIPFEVDQIGTAPDGAGLTLSASTDAPGATPSTPAPSIPWTRPQEVPPTETTPPVTTTTVEVPPTTTETVTTTEEAPTTTEMVTTTEVAPTTTEAVTTTTVEPSSSTRAAAPRADAGGATPVRPVTTTAVPVSVAVPVGTAPGTYAVRLTASDQGGERTATARIRVTAAPAPVPATPAPATPVPATPATPRKPISVTVKLLRSTQVSRRTRRLHLGRVTCVRDTGSCAVRSTVRIGTRTVGTVTVTVGPKASAGVTLRLSKASLRRLIARSAVATTTITADGSDAVVRTTKVSAKPR